MAEKYFFKSVAGMVEGVYKCDEPGDQTGWYVPVGRERELQDKVDLLRDALEVQEAHLLTLLSTYPGTLFHQHDLDIHKWLRQIEKILGRKAR